MASGAGYKPAKKRYKYDPEEGFMPEIDRLVQPPGLPSTSSHRDHSSISGKEDGWKNLNSQLCSFCFMGGEILCCESCPASFHLNCHEPHIEEIPEGKWICNLCSNLSPEERNSLGISGTQGPSNHSASAAVRSVMEQQRNEEAIRHFINKANGSRPIVWPSLIIGQAVKKTNAVRFTLPSYLLKKVTISPGDVLNKIRPPITNVACDICKIKNEKSPLIKCDMCPKRYHLDCLEHPPCFIPKWNAWRCPDHLENYLDERLYADSMPISRKRKLYKEFKNSVNSMKDVHKIICGFKKKASETRQIRMNHEALEWNRKKSYLEMAAFQPSTSNLIFPELNPQTFWPKPEKRNSRTKTKIKMLNQAYEVLPSVRPANTRKCLESACRRRYPIEKFATLQHEDDSDVEDQRRSIPFTVEELFKEPDAQNSLLPRSETADKDWGAMQQVMDQMDVVMVRNELLLEYGVDANEATLWALSAVSHIRGAAYPTTEATIIKDMRNKKAKEMDDMLVKIGNRRHRIKVNASSTENLCVALRTPPFRLATEARNSSDLRRIKMSSEFERLSSNTIFVHEMPKNPLSHVSFGYDYAFSTREERANFRVSSFCPWSRAVFSVYLESWQRDHPFGVEEPPVEVPMIEIKPEDDIKREPDDDDEDEEKRRRDMEEVRRLLDDIIDAVTVDAVMSKLLDDVVEKVLLEEEMSALTSEMTKKSTAEKSDDNEERKGQGPITSVFLNITMEQRKQLLQEPEPEVPSHYPRTVFDFTEPPEPITVKNSSSILFKPPPKCSNQEFFETNFLEECQPSTSQEPQSNDESPTTSSSPQSNRQSLSDGTPLIVPKHAYFEPGKTTVKEYFTKMCRPMTTTMNGSVGAASRPQPGDIIRQIEQHPQKGAKSTSATGVKEKKEGKKSSTAQGRGQSTVPKTPETVELKIKVLSILDDAVRQEKIAAQDLPGEKKKTPITAAKIVPVPPMALAGVINGGNSEEGPSSVKSNGQFVSPPTKKTSPTSDATARTVEKENSHSPTDLVTSGPLCIEPTATRSASPQKKEKFARRVERHPSLRDHDYAIFLDEDAEEAQLQAGAFSQQNRAYNVLMGNHTPPLTFSGKRRGRPPGSRNKSGSKLRPGVTASTTIHQKNIQIVEPAPTPNVSPATSPELVTAPIAQASTPAVAATATKATTTARGKGRGRPKGAKNITPKQPKVKKAKIEGEPKPRKMSPEKREQLLNDCEETRKKAVARILGEWTLKMKTSYVRMRDEFLQQASSSTWETIATVAHEQRVEHFPFEPRFFLADVSIKGFIIPLDRPRCLSIAVQRCLTKFGSTPECHVQPHRYLDKVCPTIGENHCDLVFDEEYRAFYLIVNGWNEAMVGTTIISRTHLTETERTACTFKHREDVPLVTNCVCFKELQVIKMFAGPTSPSNKTMARVFDGDVIRIGCAKFRFESPLAARR